MKRFILTLAILVTVALLQVAVVSSIRRHFAADTAVAAVRSPAGPELESATDTMAIVRWTTPNPGGTALHYGVVHYGTSAMSLTQVARSPNRRNPSNSEMIFRVRVAALNAHTTYYYTVESIGATGGSDGASSPVRTFQTK